MVLIFLMLPFAANIVVLPPPLDMAKEAICALLAILERCFEAFSSSCTWAQGAAGRRGARRADQDRRGASR